MIEKMESTTVGFMFAYPADNVALSDASPKAASPSRPTLAPAPRELTDSEVRAMWGKYPGLTIADFDMDMGE